MKIWKKRFGLCLAVFLLVLFQPLTAHAANDTPFVPWEPEVPEEEETSFYYGRNALAELPNSTALLYAYDAIAAGIESSAETITVWNGTNALSEAELELVMDTYRRDYAHHFWLGNSYGVGYNSQTMLSISPQYLLSGDALTAARTAFEAEIEDILADLRADWGDFEKELYFHDLLADRVTYTEATHAHNAYGALVEGKAVCEGYAEALQVLLHRAGIPSYLVTGWSYNPATGTPEGHEWNVVCIDDAWYHVDATWDDQDDTLFHAYFNLTDAMIEADHIIDETPYALPDCTSDAANYFTVKGGKVTEFDVNQIGAMMKQQGSTIHVYLVGDQTTVNDYLSTYLQEENIRALIEITGAAGGSYSYSYAALGREMVLYLSGVTPETPLEGISAAARELSDSRVYVTVTGNLGGEAADLFVAIYDENGRMIGIAAEQDFAALTAGIAFTVPFDGTADSVGVFALNDDGVPYVDAVLCGIE